MGQKAGSESSTKNGSLLNRLNQINAINKNKLQQEK